ncbi:hypothetical protein EDB87DRAFT_1580439 [Lactarius vividus]|nr:hypothetical protein EDB87DRAFT_1580439 [Lactarius vividus]
MPACIEARTPAGHSLALFSEGHPARNEVDRALALTVDPGAAGDVHRFQLSMRRKQELFTRMRDLDIAWNDWLAEAEGIDSRLRASNITSRIYPFLPQPLPRGLDVYHITEPGSNDRLGRLFRHVTLPWNAPYCTTKNAEARSASTVKIVIWHDSVRGPTSYARIPRAAMSRSVTCVSTIHVQLESYRLLVQYPTIGLTQRVLLD